MVACGPSWSRCAPRRLLGGPGGPGGHRDAADPVPAALRQAHPRPAVPSEDRRDRRDPPPPPVRAAGPSPGSGGRMRKIAVHMMLSLDGYFQGPDPELRWHLVDEE